MSIADYRSMVTEKELLTPHVVELCLEVNDPTGMEWKEGQYISMQIPSSPAPGRGLGKFEIRNNLSVGEKSTEDTAQLVRSYSICSLASDSRHVSICVDTKPGGPGSEYVQNLKIEDEVSFKGPLGKFTLDSFLTNVKDDIVFVATGTGIGPFKAMIPKILRLLKDEEKNSPVSLYFGLRHEEDIFYREFFDNLSKEYPNFSYETILSQPTNWTGKTGHVTEHVLARQNLSGAAYFLCGNMGMIKELANGLEQKGVSRENIYFESYF